MALLITALTDLTSTDQTCIGLPRSIEFSFQTDKAIAFIDDLVFYFLPVQWLNGSILTETASTPPTKSYFEALPTLATPLATLIPCSFVASTNNENNLNYKAYVQYDNIAGFVKVTFLLYSFNFSDQLNYYVGNLVNNQTKLTKDTPSNPIIFNNDQNDAYSTSRFFRIAVWIKEPSLTTLSVSFFRFQREEYPYFYQLDDARYDPKWADATFNLTFCGQESNTLSTISNSVINFTVDHLTAESVIEWYWQIYRTDTNNSSINAVNNYHLSSLKDDLSTPSWQTTHDTFTDILIFPNTVFVGSNPGLWTGAISIDYTALIVGVTYRVYILVKTDNGSTYDWWSFSSPEYVANNCQCFVKPSLNFAISGITDYLHFLGASTTTAPQERLLSQVELDWTNYNASRPFTALPNALQFINIKFYWIDSINTNIQHITDEIQLIKNVYNVWTPVSNNSFDLPDPVITIIGQVMKIETYFRNHYETNIPNLYDFNITTQANLTPTQTLDWTNHKIYIDYTFTINFMNYLDTIIVKQVNNVHDYDENRFNEMSFTVTNQSATPILVDQICSTNTLLNICSTTTDTNPTDAYLISGLDKTNYQVSNFLENETFVGVLTQLNDSLILSQESTYATSSNACAQLDLVSLINQEGLGDYRYIAIKKHLTLPEAPPCCGDPESADLSDPDYLSLISRMSITPVLSRQKIIANTIEQLKIFGLWDKIDVIYFMAAHDRQAATLNWKSPSFDLTEVNWTTNEHHIDIGTFDVTTVGIEYYDTNFNLSTDSVNYQQNNASMFQISGQNTGFFGAWSTATFSQASLSQTGGVEILLNYDGGLPDALISFTRFLGVNRCTFDTLQGFNAPNVFTNYPDATITDVTSAPIPPFSAFIRLIDFDGFPFGGPNSPTYTFYSIGSCLTEDETKTFYQIIKCYHIAVNSSYFTPLLP